MWYVKMYMNTGFNLINVPDSPSLLEQKTSKKFGVIDCLQRYFLPSITIRATEDQVIHGDFLKLYDDEDDSKYAYYVINSYTMTSGDTVVLDITMEPLLTCGGVANIDIIDGMVSRHHLTKDDEDWNRIPTEDDPLLVPTQIYIEPVAYYADAMPEHIYEYFGEAAYNLVLRSVMSEKAMLAACETYDPTNPAFGDCYWPGIQTVENAQTKQRTGIFTPGVPFKLYDNTSTTPETGRQYTDVQLKKRDFNSDYDGLEEVGSMHLADGACYIGANSTVTPDGVTNRVLDQVGRLIEFGRTDYILDAYYIPEAVADYTGGFGDVYLDDPLYIVPDYQNVYGKMITILDDNEFRIIDPEKQGYTLEPGKSGVHNKRILFGKHHSYDFVSPDNNQIITVNPEDLFCAWPNMDPDNPIDHAAAYPRMKLSVDTRPGGNMVFKILRPTGPGYLPTGAEKSLTPIVISTGPWETANIALLASPGSELKIQEYLMSSNNKDAATTLESKFSIENKNRGLRKFNPFADISAGIHRGYYMGDRGGKTLSLGSMTFNTSNNTYANTGLGSMEDAFKGASRGNEYDKARYDRLAARELEDMQFANSIIPQPQVISKSSGSNMVTGQGLVVYRNRVSAADLQRFDTIINKYGCKHTTALTKEMLTCRPLFNYIETNGVSIKCSTVPKSVRDDLANALNTGIRIWHTANVDINAWNDYAEEES